MTEPRATPQAINKAERLERRRLEKSVSWTRGERLRFMWYWFWLAFNDAQGVSGWILALPPSDAGEGEQASWARSISPY